jgi:hypothetical protein
MFSGMLQLKCHIYLAVQISVGVNVKLDRYNAHTIIEVKCIEKKFVSRV